MAVVWLAVTRSVLEKLGSSVDVAMTGTAALETLRGATSCGGKGWERITDPDRVTVVHFRVEKTLRPGFAPELTLALSAAFAGREGRVFQAHHAVTGYNL
jgi:prepilin peptidase dependent protein B